MNKAITLVYRVKIFFIDLVSIFVYIVILLKKIIGFGMKDNDVRVIIYHSVGIGDSLPIKIEELNVDPQLFDAQMKYLKRNFGIISMPEFYESLANNSGFKKNTVVITFDDGHENIFENAYPVMKRQSIPAALFVTYDFVEKNTTFPWMGSSPLGKPLDWQEVNLMKDIFNIYSHSLSHRNLCTLNDDELKKECFDSKRLIAGKTKEDVDFFAYPKGSFGSFNSRVEKFLKEAGYKLAFLNINGHITKYGSFNITRTRIINRDTLWRFKLKLAGAYDWLDSLKSCLIKNVKE